MDTPSASISILVVDDDPDVAELAATFLERANDRFRVHTAEGAEAGLAMLADGAVDCIVSDYEMHGRNGVVFLEAVREDHPDLPFILHTGKGSEEVASEAISAGVTDYLQKDGSPDQYAVLANRIANAVERVRVERERRRHLDAIETAREGIGILDPDGSFAYVNETFADLYGYTAAELEGEHWRLLYPEHEVEAIRTEILPQVRATGYWHGETTGLRRNGSRFDQDHVLATTDDGTLVCTVRDVSDRRTWVDRALDVVDDLFYFIDADDESNRWNERWCRVTGYDDEEIAAMQPEELFSPDDRDRVAAAIEEALEAGETVLEAELLTAEGERIPYEFTGNRITDPDGGTAGVVGIGRDVSARKRRERRYDAIFNHTYQFTGLLEPDGTLIEANDAALVFGGLDRADVLGKKLWETHWFQHSEETRNRGRTAVERAAAGEFVRHELPVQGGDVATIIDFSVRPVRNDRGEVTLLVPEGRDITELKRQERAITKLHRSVRDLLDAETPPTVADRLVTAMSDILDLPICAVWFHEQTEAALEPVAWSAASAALLGEHPTFRPGDSLAWDVFESNEVRQYDDVSAVADRYNPETTIRSELVLPLGDHGVVLVGSTDVGAFDAIDVTLARTATKHAETALDRLVRERDLELQSRRLDEFASLVSHDLRNPLNVAQGRLELARQDHTSDHLEIVASAHDRMNDLIDDLLTLARQGERVRNPEPVALVPCLTRCWATVATGPATLELDVDRTIRADESRLRQVFENLFRNAVEHGPADVTVRVGELPDGFYVEDDGPGIPESERERVTEPGYSTAGDGTGIGLAIVMEVVDAHGWEVRITDGTSGGARFEMTGVAIVEESRSRS